MRCLFLLLLLIGAASSAAAAPVYRALSCPFAHADAQCGEAILAEDRAQQRGKVSVAIIQLGSGANGRPPAIVLGGGGPGGGLYLDDESIIHTWDDFRRRILGEDGRLILMDQRGSGLSRPRLDCPEEKALLISLLQHPLAAEEEGAQWRALLQQCYARLTAAGIAIEAYTTTAAADDAEAIRRLLGIEKWHLIGFSYGSRLALEVLRRHPHGVASAMLDSPYPYDANTIMPFYTFEAAVTLIAAHCREQPGCRRHGALGDNLRSALTQAADNPLTLTQSYRSTTYAMVLAPHRLLEILYHGLYYETGAAVLPFYSRQLAQGDAGTANGEFFAYRYLDFTLGESLSAMLYWTIACRESRWLPPPPQTRLQVYEHTYWQEHHKTCTALWPAAALPPAPVIADDKSVLILSGRYDPITPPSYGKALMRRLPRAQHIIATSTHTPSLNLPCLQETIYDFFNAPSAPVNSHCSEDELLTFY